MNNKLKKIILTAASAALLLGAVGTTLAYIIADAGPLANVFTPSHVVNEIIEPTYTTTEKKDVKVKNTGDTTAYFRAAIVATWVKTDDSSKIIYAAQPVLKTDYTIEIGTDWVGADGYYYYKYAVAPNNETTALITSCQLTEVANVPTGYTLSVEILSQAIQAEPKDAVESVWTAVYVNDNGNLEKVEVETDEKHP